VPLETLTFVVSYGASVAGAVSRFMTYHGVIAALQSALSQHQGTQHVTTSLRTGNRQRSPHNGAAHA
jgi:hypothetical protein